MIYPYLKYCNLVLAILDNKLSVLVLLQKKIIRLANKTEYNAHINPLFKNMSLLKFQVI